MMIAPLKCNWGQIRNTYVPAVTYCTLVAETAYNNNLGSYANGFWTQSGNSSLPFLGQSLSGQHINPVLNN
jgi:hypothetical protein